MSCVHWTNYKAVKGFKHYWKIHIKFVKNGLHKSKKMKKLPFCYVCNMTLSEGPLSACLHCHFVGCYRGDMQDHAEMKSHYLFADLEYGDIRCNVCLKYIVDHDLESAAVKVEALLNNITLTMKSLTLKNKTEITSRNTIVQNPDSGLRGLVNLHNNCYMNAIVQVLVHIPVFRDYCIAKKHNRCFKKQCFMCEMNNILSEFYSNKTTPLMLLNLYNLISSCADNFNNGEQQDAHEFFLLLLSQIYNDSQLDVAVSIPDEPTLTESVFSGCTQSDLVCQLCNGISTTIEQSQGISLDIPKNYHGVTCSDDCSLSGERSCISSDGHVTLIDCLEQFTKPEIIENVQCSNCNRYAMFTKQLSVKTLPEILCLHLKRFEFSSNYSIKKISLNVSFPVELDMTPYLSYYINQPSTLNEENCDNSDDNNNKNVSAHDNKYSLIAVVNHEGTVHFGHYKSYIRQQHNQWFMCNDHIIHGVELNDILNCEGYMLFYQKN